MVELLIPHSVRFTPLKKEVCYMQSQKNSNEDGNTNNAESQEAAEKEELDLTFCQRVRRFLFQRPYVLKLTFLVYRVYKFFEE